MATENTFIQCLVVHKAEEGYKLSHQIHQACAEAKTIEVLPSWEDAIQYLNREPKPDLILGSYELTELHPSTFDRLDKKIPVVFTSSKPFVTEKAFWLNCIDFVPDNPHEDRLKRTFDKYKLLHSKASAKQPMPAPSISPEEKNAQKSRFLVKSGDHLFQKTPEDVAFFLADKGQTFLVEMGSGELYQISHKLLDLENQLDSKQFFRINRSVIINVKAIGAIKKHVNNRLKITPKIDYQEEIIVSREKVSKFKKWVNQ